MPSITHFHHIFSVAFMPVVESHPGHLSPTVNLMTHSEVMHALVLVWHWGSSLEGAVVGVYNNGQLPSWIMTVTRRVYFTLGSCFAIKRNDRGSLTFSRPAVLL